MSWHIRFSFSFLSLFFAVRFFFRLPCLVRFPDHGKQHNRARRNIHNENKNRRRKDRRKYTYKRECKRNAKVRERRTGKRSACRARATFPRFFFLPSFFPLLRSTGQTDRPVNQSSMVKPGFNTRSKAKKQCALVSLVSLLFFFFLFVSSLNFVLFFAIFSPFFSFFGKAPPGLSIFTEVFSDTN